MEKLIVIGAGGYAKSVLDSVDIYNYEIVGFIDEFTNEKVHMSYQIIIIMFILLLLEIMKNEKNGMTN